MNIRSDHMQIVLELNEYELDALEESLLYLMRDKTHEIKCDPDHEDPRTKNIHRSKRANANKIFADIMLQKRGIDNGKR